MTEFWLYAALLIIAGIFIVIWPVWQSHRKKTVDRTALNVGLYEERIAELGSQLEAGEMSAAQHDEALQEAGKLLLEDTAKADEARRPSHRGAPWVLVVAALVLPVVVISLYMTWGNPAGLALVQEMRDSPAPENLAGYIDRMERITQVQPENGEVWYMLGRAYLADQQPDKSVLAFGQSLRRLGERPEVLAQLAQARFFAGGNELDSEAVAALSRALELDPNEPTALGLLGIAAFEGGDYAGAISYWERLQAGMPPGGEGALAIQGGIDRARAQLNESGSATAKPAAPGVQVSIRLELDDALAAQLPDDAAVFVSARDPNGPPMPLFAERLTKSQLPLEVMLDTKDALMPGTTMQAGQKLQLSARISVTGDVMQASHAAAPVDLVVGEQAGPVVLRIDQAL